MSQQINQRTAKTKQLSRQLDLQIQKVNHIKISEKHSQANSITPFQLLEQRLRRLQEKLEKVKESDSKYNVEKLSLTKNQSSSRMQKLKPFFEQDQAILDNQDKNDHKEGKIKVKKSMRNQSHFTNRKDSFKDIIISNHSSKYNSITSNQRNTGVQQSFNKSQQRPFSNTKKGEKFIQEHEQSIKKKAKSTIKKAKKNNIDQLKNKSTKKERIVSQKIQSAKITVKNSNLNTPQRKKRVIVSTGKLNKRFSKTQAKATSEVKYDNNNEDEQNRKQMNRTSSKKKVSSSVKKQANFSIEPQYESGYKMLPKKYQNSNSTSKLKKKSLTATSQKEMFRSNRKQGQQRYKLTSMITDIKQDKSTNLGKGSLSSNELRSHFLNAFREPMIPLKEKIHVVKQLKETSKENLKLKEQINKLYKFEQQYWKMKQIFQKFEKQRKLRKNKVKEKQTK